MDKGPKRGSFNRSRNLNAFNRKFSKNIVENTIKKALKTQKKVRVLEIGCGEGRVLMELCKLFPTVEFHGINKEPWQVMKGSASLKRTATFYKIFTPSQLKNVKLPEIHFYEANELKFEKNYFDLIISQVAIQYVERKDLLIQDVWRVLKKGGKAFLNIDTESKGFPDYMKFDSPRFTIYKNDKIVPLKRYISTVKKSGFDIVYKTYFDLENNVRKKRINLWITKNKSLQLKLKLQFDKISSLNMNKIKFKVNKYVTMGYRSVYSLKK